MLNLLPQPLESLFLTFFFVYLRVGAAVFSMPVLSADSVSRPIRAGIAFWVAVVLAGPMLGLAGSGTGLPFPAAGRIYNGILDFSLAVLAEMAIGLSLGFAAQTLLSTIGLAGEMIGQQSGFSAASVFDPITGQDVFLIAQIKIWIGLMIFLVINGPETVLTVAADSFRIIGPGEGFPLGNLGAAGHDVFLMDSGRRAALISVVFKMGLQLAAPMIAAMMLVNIAEAFIARTAPQLNILAVGFAIRISLSLFILWMSMRYIVIAFQWFLTRYTTYAEAFLSRLAPS
ncbi:MAG TPA: flagellar biosynthetic protein FliR [bacterium]|nr:flagellar biosynthetic protein FliR [bacterium]